MQSPEATLQQAYSQFTQDAQISGPHRQDWVRILNLMAEAHQAAAEARTRVRALHNAQARGQLTPQQVTAQQETLLSQARQVATDRLELAASLTNGLPVLLEREVFPPVPQRTPGAVDAKSDLRLALDGMPADQVGEAMAQLYREAHANNDQHAVSVLHSDWGRHYLRSRVGEDRDAQAHWERFRAEAAQTASKHATGEVKANLEALGKVPALTKAVTVAKHLVALHLEAATEAPQTQVVS